MPPKTVSVHGKAAKPAVDPARSAAAKKAAATRKANQAKAAQEAAPPTPLTTPTEVILPPPPPPEEKPEEKLYVRNVWNSKVRITLTEENKSRKIELFERGQRGDMARVSKAEVEDPMMDWNLLELLEEDVARQILDNQATNQQAPHAALAALRSPTGEVYENAPQVMIPFEQQGQTVAYTQRGGAGRNLEVTEQMMRGPRPGQESVPSPPQQVPPNQQFPQAPPQAQRVPQGYPPQFPQQQAAHQPYDIQVQEVNGPRQVAVPGAVGHPATSIPAQQADALARAGAQGNPEIDPAGEQLAASLRGQSRVEAPRQS